MPLQNINIGTTANDGTGDDARTWAGKTNANFSYLENLINSLSTEVENAPYADMAALYADQGNQTTGKIQYVLDASAHSAVSSGARHFEYYGTTDQDEDDYRLLSTEESVAILYGADFRTFTIKEINLDSAPISTVDVGGISFEYNSGSGKVTRVIFNLKFSEYVADCEALGKSVSLKLWNKSAGDLHISEVSSYTTLGSYKAVNIEANLTATDLTVGNTLEVTLDVGSASSGGSEPTLETSLPGSGIVVDGTKKYHIESGIIKPAIQTASHVEGKDVEIISNPANGASLVIDLTDYPYIQLQGGGFTESPANYYTLETDEASSLLKQHLTLMLWRRGNLFISNSMNYLPNSDVIFSTVVNNLNQYVTVTFNRTIAQADLVIGNFSKTFTQNGDAVTDITLDSITDNDGVAISGNEQIVRIYFSYTGSSTGLASFTLTATELNDLYGNTSTNEVSPSASMLSDTVNIEDYANVIAYWKEGSGDNTTGTATKTDIVNSKVLSASGESNPTLASNVWSFNGTNQGFRLVDSEINTLLGQDIKDMQVHFVGNFKVNNTRILVGCDVGTSPNSLWNFIYRTGSEGALAIYDTAGDNVIQGGMDIDLDETVLVSIKFHRKDLGAGIVNAVDVYIDDGVTIDSHLDINASIINASNIEEIFIGMRETTAKSFYNVEFNSLVIANSSDNFDDIRGLLAL